MNNQLVRIEKLSTTDIMTTAKAFAESGMFPDIKSAAQAVVKIQAGQEMGIPPFAAMSGIHIIQGKPTVGAGLMAARVKSYGKYDYKIIQLDEKACSLDFYKGKEKQGNSTFTAEDAKKADTKNMNKFPKNMLFARAMSNGVKWFCPDIFDSPVYVPEEMGGTSEETVDTDHEVVFAATEDQWKEANELIKSSPLDDNGRAIATDMLANAANLVEWQKIIVGLRKRQAASA